jgi:hypothetical protein
MALWDVAKQNIIGEREAEGQQCIHLRSSRKQKEREEGAGIPLSPVRQPNFLPLNLTS